jgi:uncharacterized phage-associated protein
MLYFKFDRDKALATILYISKRLIDRSGRRAAGFHKVFKILYFADQKHLSKYGRPIVGDYYIAMEHGPVPSKIYDMIKIVRGDSFIEDTMNLDIFFDVSEHFIFPKQNPAMDELSESELDCIKDSLTENQELSFSELKRKSHDRAYQKALKDDKISFIEIAKVAGADNEMIRFIQMQSKNEKALSS